MGSDDDSTGFYSGQLPLVHSLSPGYSTYLSINTVLSLNSSIMVVSPFLIPYLGRRTLTSVSAKEGRKKAE